MHKPNDSSVILVGFEMLPTPRAVFRKRSEALTEEEEVIAVNESSTTGNSVTSGNQVSGKGSVKVKNILKTSSAKSLETDENVIENKPNTPILSPLLQGVSDELNTDIFGFEDLLYEDANENKQDFMSKKTRRRLESFYSSSDSSLEYSHELNQKLTTAQMAENIQFSNAVRRNKRKNVKAEHSSSDSSLESELLSEKQTCYSQLEFDKHTLPPKIFKRTEPVHVSISSTSSDSDTKDSEKCISSRMDHSEANSISQKYPNVITLEKEDSLSSTEAHLDEDISSDNSDGEEYDSDFEPGDTESYTTIRVQNKKIRHSSRNINILPLHLKSGNIEFIEAMTKFLKQNTIDTGNAERSTVTKTIRHLFLSSDSLLSFEVERNCQFKLQNWRNFQDANYMHLKYPLDWITKTCHKDGVKGCERLKAHCSLRRYIEYEVDKADSSESFSAIKISVRSNLNSISTQISKNKLYMKYNSLSKQLNQQKKKAAHVLQPSKPINIQNLVSTWYSSLEYEETERDYQFIYENAMKTKHISISNMTSYAIYVRLSLLLRIDIYKLMM